MNRHPMNRHSIFFALAGPLAVASVIFAQGAGGTFAKNEGGDKTQVKSNSNLAAAGQVAVRQPYAAQGWLIPQEVDLEDATERFLLLLPGGPLIVEATITIDGQPFRAHRECMVVETLKAGDADEDGMTTWKELTESKAIKSSRYAAYFANAQTRASTIQQYDLDRDEIVSPYELRSLLARFNGGPALMMTNYASRGGGQASPVRDLLDADGDGTISVEELADAASRLKSRDADDNDILDAAELGGGGQAARYGGGIVVTRGGGAAAASPVLFHLSSETDFSELYTHTSTFIAEKKNLEMTAALLKLLDKNDDGRIDAIEIEMILDIEPDVTFDVQLGEGAAEPANAAPAGQKTRTGSPVKVAGGAGGTVTIELPGAMLQILVADIAVNFSNYDRQATAMLTRLDADKNGYLDKKELESQRGYSQFFAQWDADGDGMVYEKEIKAFYRASQAPMWNRVSVGVADSGDALFAALDQTGDGRISLREMRTAKDRLAASDKNDDGKITLEEVPSTVKLGFGRGNYAYQVLANRNVVQRPIGRPGVGGAPAPGSAGPRWFTSMDTNGDGDITLREFLGSAAQFAELDTNSDGFIERQEAESAK